MRLIVGASSSRLKLPVISPSPSVSTSGPAIISSSAAPSRKMTLMSFHMMVSILRMVSPGKNPQITQIKNNLRNLRIDSS